MLIRKSGRFVYAPFDGTVVSLDKVPDEAFAEKMLGDGIAILPSSNTIYSPVKGVVSSAFPTGHAYTFVTSSNYGVLLHIGLETVTLKGQGFTTTTKVGDRVDKTTSLGTVNWAQISSKVKSMISPIVVVDDPDRRKGVVELKVKHGQKVKAGDLLFIINNSK